MGKPMLVVSSITYAMRGQKILENHGIPSSIERDIKALAKYGCGYGLRVSVGSDQTAKDILTKGGIKVLAVID